MNKGKQRARTSSSAEDGDDEGDEDDEMLDLFVPEGANGNGEAASLQEEINEWARVQLEKIDADIEAAKKRIADLDERKTKAEARAADSRTRFRLGYAGKKMGAFQLDKIRKSQTDAEATAKKTNDELLRAQEKLLRLEELRDDVEFDTMRKFTEAKAKHRPRKPRKLGNRHYPPEHNLDSGDDSLSDAIRIQDEKERIEREKKGLSPTAKAPRACRRCKVSFLDPILLGLGLDFRLLVYLSKTEPVLTRETISIEQLGKQACTFIPGTASCNACAITGQRCRYKENFSGDKQIRPWLIHDKLDEIAALKAELAKFREKSTVSVGAENPLSGITGYGPPTQKLARQNWALMVRGHPPRPPLATSTAGGDSSSTAKRKCKALLPARLSSSYHAIAPIESNDAKPSQPAKRQRLTEPNPPKLCEFSDQVYPMHCADVGISDSFQNETAETLAGPSKRGRKPGQTYSTRKIRQTQQTGKPISAPF